MLGGLAWKGRATIDLTLVDQGVDVLLTGVSADDLRSAEVDFLTIGQYLQPTRKHHAVMRYVTPDEFAGYERVAYTKGFLMVSASPLTRSSHHAGEDFAKLQAARTARGR